MGMNIKKKLILGFLAVSLLTGVIGYFALKQIDIMDKVFGDVAEDTVPLVASLEELRFAGLRIVSSTNEYGFINSQKMDSGGEEEENLIAEGRARYEEAMSRYTTLVNDACRVPEAKVQYQVILNAGKRLQESSNALLLAIKRGERGERLLKLKERLEEDEIAFLAAIDLDLKQEMREFAETREREIFTVSQANQTIITATFVTFIIALLSGIAIATTISRPISRLKEAAVRIGAGDFNAPLDVSSKDEVGELSRAFADMANARKGAEEGLRESNEEVKNFAYVVSHDLRAPLVSIKGFSTELVSSVKELEQMVSPYLERMTEEERKRFTELTGNDIPEATEFIGSSVSRMERQINAILSLSRIGHRELVPKQVDSAAVVDEILKSLAHQIEEHRVKVTKENLPVITTDKISLEQIFGNLIDNALKYLDPERDGKISITSEATDREVIFHVADNGLGIPAEFIGNVFDLFSRGGKKDVQGEGMGLARVKALIRRNGGRIWVNSQWGVGTTFSFTLPLTFEANNGDRGTLT